MSLTQDQVEKLSKMLSKLGIKNKKKLTTDINAIIWYIDILEEVDTNWVDPTVSVVKTYNKLRKDEIDENNDENPKELLACSNGKVIWNQIAISNIMK